jgi:enamine deaminase RidA (YjgF/YER057c/UK114 family)
LDEKSGQTLDNASEQLEKLRKNRDESSFLQKVQTRLWNNGDLYISGQLKESINYGMLTNQGRIEEEDEKANARIEVVIEDAGAGTPVPGLEIEVFLKKNGEEMMGPIELPFLFKPGRSHYGKNIDIPEGEYSIILNAFNPQKEETVELSFESVMYSAE